MTQRKKSNDYKSFAEVQGWRTAKTKNPEINLEFHVNHPYSVRSLAEFNKSPKYPEMSSKIQHLPQLDTKESTRQNSKDFDKGKKNFKSSSLGKRNSVFSSVSNLNSKVSDGYKGGVGERKSLGSKGNVQSSYFEANEEKEVVEVKELAKTKSLGVVAQQNKIGKKIRIDFESHRTLVEKEDIGLKTEQYKSPKNDKGRLSEKKEIVGGAEREEKFEETRNLYTTEKNSCFLKVAEESKDEKHKKTKISFQDIKLPSYIEAKTSRVVLVSSRLIPVATDSGASLLKNQKKKLLLVNEMEHEGQKRSELGCTGRSLSETKFFNEKEPKEYSIKEPITPNNQKINSQKWSELQLAPIQEEPPSAKSPVKSETIKKNKKLSITQKNAILQKDVHEKISFSQTVKNDELNEALKDFHLKPFSRDRSPQEQYSDFYKSNEAEIANSIIQQKTVDVEKPEEQVNSIKEIRKSALDGKIKIKKPKEQKRFARRLRRGNTQVVVNEKSLKKIFNIGIPLTPVYSEEIKICDEKNASDEIKFCEKSKPEVENFINNYSISMFSLLTLLLVDFKGNIVTINDELDIYQRQKRKGFIVSEIFELYPQRIKTKMIFELKIALHPLRDLTNLKNPEALVNRINAAGFSQGIKKDLISYISSVKVFYSVKSLKKTLGKIIKKRLNGFKNETESSGEFSFYASEESDQERNEKYFDVNEYKDMIRKRYQNRMITQIIMDTYKNKKKFERKKKNSEEEFGNSESDFEIERDEENIFDSLQMIDGFPLKHQIEVERKDSGEKKNEC